MRKTGRRKPRREGEKKKRRKEEKEKRRKGEKKKGRKGEKKKRRESERPMWLDMDSDHHSSNVFPYLPYTSFKWFIQLE